MGKADLVQSSTVKGTSLSTFRSAWVIKGKLSSLADYGFISSPFSNGAGSGLLHIFPGLGELNLIFLWPVPANTRNTLRLGVTAVLGLCILLSGKLPWKPTLRILWDTLGPISILQVEWKRAPSFSSYPFLPWEASLAKLREKSLYKTLSDTTCLEEKSCETEVIKQLMNLPKTVEIPIRSK